MLMLTDAQHAVATMLASWIAREAYLDELVDVGDLILAGRYQLAVDTIPASPTGDGFRARHERVMVALADPCLDGDRLLGMRHRTYDVCRWRSVDGRPPVMHLWGGCQPPAGCEWAAEVMAAHQALRTVDWDKLDALWGHGVTMTLADVLEAAQALSDLP